MRWEFVIALIIAIPVILFPAAFIWYMNIGRIYAVVKGALKRRAAREKESKVVARATRR